MNIAGVAVNNWQFAREEERVLTTKLNASKTNGDANVKHAKKWRRACDVLSAVVFQLNCANSESIRLGNFIRLHSTNSEKNLKAVQLFISFLLLLSDTKLPMKQFGWQASVDYVCTDSRRGRGWCSPIRRRWSIFSGTVVRDKSRSLEWTKLSPCDWALLPWECCFFIKFNLIVHTNPYQRQSLQRCNQINIEHATICFTGLRHSSGTKCLDASQVPSSVHCVRWTRTRATDIYLNENA